MSLLVVRNIGKAFRSYYSEWQRVASWLGISVKAKDENWVLRHINFEVYPGQAVGLIGLNGAGKSTLLKIITGTLQATEGEVSVNGRISSILELGMGFNNELTGRQNAIHTTGMMGFSAEQIEKAMPDIEAFAEIGEYFDQPVKSYSSGMQMRVAFAVATAYCPEILIVDEALSVGDAYFQHKSFARIREFQEKGTTLLFVSHDMGTLKTLCDRAIILHEGEMLFSGDAEAAAERYTELLNRDKDTTALQENHSKQEKFEYGTGEVEVLDVDIFDKNKNQTQILETGQKYLINVKIKAIQPISSLTFGYLIKDRLGLDIYGTNTAYTEQVLDHVHEGETITFNCEFDANLGPGSYSLSVAFVQTDGVTLFKNYKWLERVCIFEVINSDKKFFIGSSWLPATITIEKD